MTNLPRKIARLFAAVLLLWANASFAIAGIAGGAGAVANDPFGDGNVICTPNGLITLSPEDVAALFGEDGEPPADALIWPVCPDCALGAAVGAANSPSTGSVALTETRIRFASADAASAAFMRSAAYRSRAPPASFFA
ncbi:MAG: hypothetical protein AAFN79_20065 [Pseudomonadota bacterium]